MTQSGIEKTFHVPHGRHEVQKYQLKHVRDYMESIEAVPLEDGKWRIKK